MTVIDSRSAFHNFARTLLHRPDSLQTPATARLPEGLEMVFERVPDGHMRRRWRLVLAREHSYPTIDEVEACCIAFKIPPSVTQKQFTDFRVHQKSKRRMHMHVVELTWQETDEEVGA